jgi:hypothetical protein
VRAAAENVGSARGKKMLGGAGAGGGRRKAQLAAAHVAQETHVTWGRSRGQPPDATCQPL